jgi:uncharacterized protein (TIGR00730 family)
MKVIAVFGSSVPQAGSAPYEEARLVGRLIAEAGFAVATGGYSGTMAAVSQGAAEAGGHVIGVTCTQIDTFRAHGPNRWVQEEIRYHTLRERLLHLVMNNDGLITLPGGIGTLSEVTLAWSFLQVGEITPRPFALLGKMWPPTIQAYYDDLYIKPEHMELLYFAASAATAVTYISHHLHPQTLK